MASDANEHAVLLNVLKHKTQIASDEYDEAQIAEAEKAGCVRGVVTEGGGPRLRVHGGGVAVFCPEGLLERRGTSGGVGGICSSLIICTV